MAAALEDKQEKVSEPGFDKEIIYIQEMVKRSFKVIAPFWPLKNLIAVNPLQGLEDIPIETAIPTASHYFQPKNLPQNMEKVNLETIKWLQAYFDEGQATLTMPLRAEGLYSAWRQLAIYDVNLHNNESQKKEWLRSLAKSPEDAIRDCLLKLGISSKDQEIFLTLILCSLSGWASYIKYRTEWAKTDPNGLHPIRQTDYVAVRLIITSLLWPEANLLIKWYQNNIAQTEAKINLFREIEKNEADYCVPLLKKISEQPLRPPYIPQAQIVFCIDTRSEPFRKALESVGDYQTFGFAGFFGLPVTIKNAITGESYPSCPVLLSPKHVVTESPGTETLCLQDCKGYAQLNTLKRLYQSVKYTFAIPFALVESLGIISGMWMALRTLFPGFSAKLKLAVIHAIRKPIEVVPSLEEINFTEQCAYAESALRMMGLTQNFAPLIVFCGHGSTTQNNAYATALDCGACGGRHGASNARVLACILNRREIKEQLAKNGILIPLNTTFIAAEHNTTTDEVKLYNSATCKTINDFKENLEKARVLNSSQRLNNLKRKIKQSKPALNTWLRSEDWAQVLPEWGLARNAAFIIGPRALTAALDLEGRAFLHSYDYTVDPESNLLTTILTAPMVVAQWINAQYFFSTLDNTAYGGGSKITQNITGKIAVMQGNASDLMTGLPLQSVYKTDLEPYHKIQRLLTIVYAPQQKLDLVLHSQPMLQKLFKNGWVKMACIEPENQKTYLLNRDLTWQKTD
ncbi:MAG: DUF2309 domain-containing protein [Gammaproteobacteria bacterium]|nr:DUF2309 domain-containing protein [Gammaproteobacteria bacterium]